MDFTKKQLLIFLIVIVILISALSANSVFSFIVIKQYLNSENTVVVADSTAASDETTQPAESEEETTSADTATTAISVVNAQPNDNSGNTKTTSKSAVTTTEKTNKTPSTKEEIAALYKTANQNAKSKAKTATMTYKNATNYNDVCETGGLSKAASILMNLFLKEEPDYNEVHTDDISTAVPPNGAACNLKASDIKEATCEDKGTYYFVTILLYPDTNPKAGFGSGSICSVITEEQITEGASKASVTVSNIVCEYDGAYCEAKIDKSTNNLTELYTKMPMYLNLSAKGLGGIIKVDNGRIGLQFEERWTIEY